MSGVRISQGSTAHFASAVTPAGGCGDRGWHTVAVSTSPIQTATATLHTNRGDIKIALFGNHAPKTVANFVGPAQGTKGLLDAERLPAERPALLRRRDLPPASSTAS